MKRRALVSIFPLARPSRGLAVCALGLASLLGLAGCKSSTTDGPPSLGGAAPNTASGSAASVITPEKATEKAPELYKARFSTSKGDFIVEVHREWAPLGADRFYNLVKGGFYDNVRFFRVVSGFMAQFGIHGDPGIAKQWSDANIQDDPGKQSNGRGFVTFATAGPNTRTTQVFLNLVDNNRLDSMGFAPFGRVTAGMEVVDQLYAGYGEGAPRGKGPFQGKIQAEGNAYLERDFPQMDFVKKATIDTEK
jgi:peptidyl-prolyl cis-trans isomerase A (cyclophilin A)